MKLALVGYGQMGHMLRSVAEKRGHKVVLTVDPFAEDADFKPASPAETAAKIKESGAEGIIEFSHPTSVMGNIEALLRSSCRLLSAQPAGMTSAPKLSSLH